MPAFEETPWRINEAFESFCRGVHAFGPFHDHVLYYWMESLKNPVKILFLRNKDMKRDPKEQVKKLASFLGKPYFSRGKRRGLVGDKKNCLAEETKERLDKVTHMKFEGSGMEVQI
ncbi:hypothetical protein SCA6_017175 [Theobroma cacao]